MKNYVPISCALYDQFEAAAVKKTDCEITYLKDGSEKSVNTKIVNFKSFDRQEFMIIQDGTVIRIR